MSKVWIVTGEKGQWSEHQAWIASVWYTETEANVECKRLNDLTEEYVRRSQIWRKWDLDVYQPALTKRAEEQGLRWGFQLSWEEQTAIKVGLPQPEFRYEDTHDEEADHRSWFKVFEVKVGVPLKDGWPS
jgi:hypothetical protein